MKPTMFFLAAVMCSLPMLSDAFAGQYDLVGPAGSGEFGATVIALPNGNFVVTDPGYDALGTNDVGAVYLYDGDTLAVISTLTGSQTNDSVGSEGVTVLKNGNYVVRSPNWDNGLAVDAGAATWCSGTTGVNGAVSEANSLVGNSENDRVGERVTVLNNGNYLVGSPEWNASRGAVTFGNGLSGVTGMVAAANSLVGSTANDHVGQNGVTVLSNNNYVVSSPSWDNGAMANVGAMTWCSGTTGATGAVSLANSLVGSAMNDFVGHVTVLSNGNYLARSTSWNLSRGAVTWCSGITGMTGVVSSANSLVGSAANDLVGYIVIPLNNGNYVVNSPYWNNGAVVDAGAVTWVNGMIGKTGAVSAVNSLVGSSTDDRIGIPASYDNNGVVALNNGNYVVSSPYWNNGAAIDAGAATWGSGTTGVTGAVSVANSLVGGVTSDIVGYVVTALNNGNYVVGSPWWNNGAAIDAGAATLGNGTTGLTGLVSVANSLVGSTTDDNVGRGAYALVTGNYVVTSPNWNNGAAIDAGAATLGNGLTGVKGVISATNSLVGSTLNGQVGFRVTALSNGNYVVGSPYWNNGGALRAGAATWANGTTGLTGAVSAFNSLVGSATDDAIGSTVTALNNGNFAMNSQYWNNGAVVDAGAVTWGNGMIGSTGVVSVVNSLVGTKTNDLVGHNGGGWVKALTNGDYVVESYFWNNGIVNSVGAVTWCDGALGVRGDVSNTNSVLGSVANGGDRMQFDFDYLNSRLIVGQPAGSRVSLFGNFPNVPEIVVEQPSNINLSNGGTRNFIGPVGTNTSLIFTIKNINIGSLTGLGITIDGSDAALFTVTTSPIAPVSGPFGNTMFTVQFAPTNVGVKSAALHIANNDPDENPFDINLSGLALSFGQDADGDSLSDASEFQMAALGFDWQVSQPALVNTLTNHLNGVGYFTSSQVQALNIDTSLLQKNPTNGLFTLTVGVQKSTDLTNFIAFPMTAPQTIINAQGELEFQFNPPDNAAFFRLESK